MGKIESDKHIVEQMITLYCRSAHSSAELCADCEQLLRYANARLDSCPYSSFKKACKRCPKHCYNRDMRDKIRIVMRFSGPRMIFRAPLATIRHLLSI